MDGSIHRLRDRDVLTLCVIGLLSLGVLMVQSASMRVRETTGFGWTDAGVKQLEFAAAALATFWAVGRWDYRRLTRGTWRRNPIVWMLGASMLLCAAVLIPHVGLQINGARRWLPLLGRRLTVQPSELAKWTVVLFLAYWLTRPGARTEQFFRGFVPMMAPVGLICLLIVIQDFGAAVLVGAGALMLCLAGGVRLRHLLVTVPLALLAGYWFVHHKTYRWTRITAFMDPYAAPRREGYHMIQSLMSFSTGGFFGTGLGSGVQKLGYLPEDTTDFIFAVIGEELGFFGAMLTVALYLGILYSAWKTIRRQRDGFGQLVALGIGAVVALQALINIAVATVSAPPKGMALPLVSAGGSGLIITCAVLGLLYSEMRQQDEAEPAATSEPATATNPAGEPAFVI